MKCFDIEPSHLVSRDAGMARAWHGAHHRRASAPRLREGLSFTAKQEKTLHSIRNTVITMLEHAGVSEGTVQDIVGHQRSTLTGSTYSGKSTLEMKRDALNKLCYPTR